MYHHYHDSPFLLLVLSHPSQNCHFVFQVDGSSDSLSTDRTTFQAQFTMRECEEQITTLKKENFNLKLRIYFMEESQGLLHSPKEQAELYKVNIDLKVKSEELKKVL